jgi:putative colanic acid biosynthesis UDP-glucose lipid carrier transferase
MSKVDKKYKLNRILLDILLIAISFLFIYNITGTAFHITNYTIFTILLSTIWLIASYFSSIYGDRRSKKFSEELTYIFYTFFLYTILLSSLSFFINPFFKNSITFFNFYIIVLLPSLIIQKYIFRKYIHAQIYKGHLYESIIIVGLTYSGLDYLDTIYKFYYYGYRCIGYIDESANDKTNSTYLGNLEKLEHILNNFEVDEIVIALSHSQTKNIQHVMELCEIRGIKVRILPDFSQYASASVQVNNIGLMPVLNIKELPLDKVENRLFKRVVDIVGILFFLILIGFWMLPIIALIIKLTTKGPILFQQERWGLNNQRIVCYKFRSMYVESKDFSSNGQYNQATKDDQRITPFGKFLRKNNLDELPQFWNVLIGNMSIVGPRPHPVQLNLESMHSVDNYMLRHIVLPGISGWAQVNGFRGETKEQGSMQKRINYDLYYIHNWTIWLDFQIILQTVINFFRGDQNAY